MVAVQPTILVTVLAFDASDVPFPELLSLSLWTLQIRIVPTVTRMVGVVVMILVTVFVFDVADL